MSQRSLADGLSLKTGMKRSHGLEAPFHRDQVMSVCAYILCTTGQFFITYAFVLHQGKTFVLVLTAALTSIVVFCWYKAASIDPEMKETTPPSCSVTNCCSTSFGAPRSTRYCLDCRKIVLEFDHHCSFLNNCVGGKNYAYFFTLVTTAFLQMMLHIVTGAMVQSHCFDLPTIHEYMELWVYYTVVELNLLISGIFAILLCCLYGFHMYLNFVAKLGTYDWMMSRRQSRYEASSPSNFSNQTHISRQHANGVAVEVEQESSVSINSVTAENMQRQLQREAYERQMRQSQASRAQQYQVVSRSNSGLNQEEIQAAEHSFRRGRADPSHTEAGEAGIASSSRRSSTSVHSTSAHISANNSHNQRSPPHGTIAVAPLDLKALVSKQRPSGSSIVMGLLTKQSPRVAIYPQVGTEFDDLERCVTNDDESLQHELGQFYLQYQQEEAGGVGDGSSKSVVTTKYS